MTPDTRIDPGSLPGAFATVGLRLLRLGRFREAQKFYEAAVEEDRLQANGWAGLGAAILSLGKVRDGGRALVTAMSLDPDFPLEVLLAETGLQPSLLFNLAELLVVDESAPARACALAAVYRCINHPCPPLNVETRASSLLRRLGVEEEPETQADAVVELPPTPRAEQPSTRTAGAALRVCALSFILVVVAFLGWSVYSVGRNERLVNQAVAHYAHAAQVTASHRDATRLYIDAFHELAALAPQNGDDIKISFLVATCGQDILERARRGQIHLSHDAADELRAATASARGELAKLDPEGSRVKQVEAEAGLQGLRING